MFSGGVGFGLFFAIFVGVPGCFGGFGVFCRGCFRYVAVMSVFLWGRVWNKGGMDGFLVVSGGFCVFFGFFCGFDASLCSGFVAVARRVS